MTKPFCRPDIFQFAETLEEEANAAISWLISERFFFKNPDGSFMDCMAYHGTQPTCKELYS